MKHKKINTSYDQFGGHSSGQTQTYKVRSNTSRTFFHRTAEQLKYDRPIYDKVAKELDTIFSDLIVKKQWQQDIKNCLQAKAEYEGKKAAGKKVKPENDPLPLDLSIMNPTKHQAAFKTILGVWHRKYRKGFNAMVTKEMLSIWPEIAKKWLFVFPDGWFLEQILERVKVVDNEPVQGQVVIPPTVDSQTKAGSEKPKADIQIQSVEKTQGIKTIEANPESPDSNTSLIWQSDAVGKRTLKDSEISGSRLIAMQSFMYALDKDKALLTATQSEIYQWLLKPNNRECDKNPYHDCKPPKEESWKAYLRSYCKAKHISIEEYRQRQKERWALREQDAAEKKYGSEPKAD